MTGCSQTHRCRDFQPLQPVLEPRASPSQPFTPSSNISRFYESQNAVRPAGIAPCSATSFTDLDPTSLPTHIESALSCVQVSSCVQERNAQRCILVLRHAGSMTLRCKCWPALSRMQSCVPTCERTIERHRLFMLSEDEDKPSAAVTLGAHDLKSSSSMSSSNSGVPT
ncbi:hypothetical protein BC830DRAFT_854442 [Chytriomyces sp. MP71]|nr:hypothetical protein BC830DRAFT_854442 [Chytriomyces sp. MP71]